MNKTSRRVSGRRVSKVKIGKIQTKAKTRRSMVRIKPIQSGGVKIMDAERERIFDEACARMKDRQPAIIKTKSGHLVLNKTKAGISMRQMYLEEQGYEFD